MVGRAAGPGAQHVVPLPRQLPGGVGAARAGHRQPQRGRPPRRPAGAPPRRTPATGARTAPATRPDPLRNARPPPPARTLTAQRDDAAPAVHRTSGGVRRAGDRGACLPPRGDVRYPPDRSGHAARWQACRSPGSPTPSAATARCRAATAGSTACSTPPCAPPGSTAGRRCPATHARSAATSGSSPRAAAAQDAGSAPASAAGPTPRRAHRSGTSGPTSSAAPCA